MYQKCTITFLLVLSVEMASKTKTGGEIGPRRKAQGGRMLWNNYPAENKKQLESIHIEASRIITGTTRLCSIKKLFSELGWESFQKP